MTWSYKGYSDSSYDTVVALMESDLNTLNSKYPNAVIMLAMCDRKGGDYHGVIYFNETLASQVAISNPIWKSHSEETSKEDYTKIYDHMETYLNGENISEQCQFWARLGYSNADGGDATLTLFYPQT